MVALWWYTGGLLTWRNLARATLRVEWSLRNPHCYPRANGRTKPCLGWHLPSPHITRLKVCFRSSSLQIHLFVAFVRSFTTPASKMWLWWLSEVEAQILILEIKGLRTTPKDQGLKDSMSKAYPKGHMATQRIWVLCEGS